MRAEMYEIVPCPQGKMAIMPRPRGWDWLLRELGSLKVCGVTDLVSLLTPEEEIELGLQDEEKICAELGIRFHRHPVKDRGVPSQPDFDNFITSLVPLVTPDSFIAIHCRAGIGRSSVIAAALLLRQGLSADEALDVISRARGFDIPDTEEQLDFIHGLQA
jgi:protein-tyrosine phosphatase